MKSVKESEVLKIVALKDEWRSPVCSIVSTAKRFKRENNHILMIQSVPG